MTDGWTAPFQVMASVTAYLATTDGMQNKGAPYFQSAASLEFTLGETMLRHCVKEMSHNV